MVFIGSYELHQRRTFFERHMKACSSSGSEQPALPLFLFSRSNLKTDRTSSLSRVLFIKNLPKKTSNYSTSMSSPLQHRNNQSPAWDAAPGMARISVPRTCSDLEKAHTEKHRAGSLFLQALLKLALPYSLGVQAIQQLIQILLTVTEKPER